MDYLEKIVGEIELHSIEGIKECFEHGIHPNDYFRGEPLIFELISEYTRTPRFKDCVKVFVDYGLAFDDKALLAVLLDDAALLEAGWNADPGNLLKKYTLRYAYTPLQEATLLHVCAEFNHVACARFLVEHGVDINARAGLDKDGFGGQTPIFHTVNQNSHNSAAMMDFLLSRGAGLELTVTGIVWGKGYEWETLIPSVNPVSYAMMGLLPQMHRHELTIANVVAELLKHRYAIDYMPQNVPCAYLHK